MAVIIALAKKDRNESLAWLRELLDSLPAHWQPSDWQTRAPLLRFMFQMAFPTVVVGGLIKDRLKTTVLLSELEETALGCPVSLAVSNYLVNRFPELARLITSLQLTEAGAIVPSWLRKLAKAIRGLLFNYAPSIDDDDGNWIPTDNEGTDSNKFSHVLQSHLSHL